MIARSAIMRSRLTERGSISIIACTAALLFSLSGLAVADAGSFLAARARAQSAADAAALAAAVAQTPVLGNGEDPTAAATAEAGRNGARLVRCDCEPGAHGAFVIVEVTPRIAFLGAWTGRTVRASARAEVDPDLLTYREDK